MSTDGNLQLFDFASCIESVAGSRSRFPGLFSDESEENSENQSKGKNQSELNKGVGVGVGRRGGKDRTAMSLVRLCEPIVRLDTQYPLALTVILYATFVG